MGPWEGLVKKNFEISISIMDWQRYPALPGLLKCPRYLPFMLTDEKVSTIPNEEILGVAQVVEVITIPLFHGH